MLPYLTLNLSQFSFWSNNNLIENNLRELKLEKLKKTFSKKHEIFSSQIDLVSGSKVSLVCYLLS